MSFAKEQTAAQRLRHLTGWVAGEVTRPVIVAEIQHSTTRRRTSAQTTIRQEVA